MSRKPKPIYACVMCHRQLNEGETAYARDYKVITAESGTATVEQVTRYTCEPCEDTR